MDEKEREQERKQAMDEIRRAEREQAVTFEEVSGREKRKKRTGFRRTGRFLFSSWKRWAVLIAVIAILVLLALPFITFKFLTLGSTFSEDKGVFLERIQDLSEIATAESYTKVIIERQDNQLFGQSIGVNLPGTKRQLLVVIPGSVKAGVDLSGVTDKDISINEKKKTATLRLPPAQFLGGAEIYFDQVEIYSYEGVFREKADIKEAYELAEEAKQMILDESAGQGVLQTAEQNAVRTLQEMFSFAGYDVTIEFKE